MLGTTIRTCSREVLSGDGMGDFSSYGIGRQPERPEGPLGTVGGGTVSRSAYRSTLAAMLGTTIRTCSWQHRQALPIRRRDGVVGAASGGCLVVSAAGATHVEGRP